MIVTVAIIFAIEIVLAMACIIVERKRRGAELAFSYSITLPYSQAVIGMVGAIFFFVLAMISVWEQNMITFYGLLSFVLLSDCLMIAYLNCEIIYDREGFRARNFWGIVRECKYSEIEGIRNNGDYRIYFRDHSLLVDKSAIGGEWFIKTAIDGYREAIGKQLPISPTYRCRWDPMNGHVDHPWFFFITYLALGLSCIVMLILIAFALFYNYDVSEIEKYNTIFLKYEIEKKDLRLYNENETVVIFDYETYGNQFPSPEQLCSGEMYLVGHLKERDGVVSLEGANGEIYITPEMERQIYREKEAPIGIALIIMLLVFAINCWLAIVVGRNPDRYSEKLKRRFYQEGILH
ncbi:MAG: hypothetical protein IKU83_03065 [Lachnospiraceae bacterium]|nr:hypothetical protein [Lachnospiraceae bacterium]